MHKLCRTLLVLALFATVACPASAHEADQYTYPPEREFADLGVYLTRYFYGAIERGVNATNQRIRFAVEAGQKDEVRKLQSPGTIAQAVNREIPVALFLIESLDDTLPKLESRQHYPGRIVLYKPKDSIREYVDIPLNPFNAWQCGSINAFGTYLGTDKIGHFTDLGFHYYRHYRQARLDGLSEQAAMQVAIRLGTDDPVTSESGLLGWGTAGAYSNADLMANFSGFLFYRNLGEPVMLKGEMRSPMCVIEGNYWKVSPRVQPDSDFYSLFISDHLNEALNPSVYLNHMRSGIRRAAAERSTATLEEYTDRFGNRHSQAWFRAKTKELSTYYGMNYGYLSAGEPVISSACFGKEPTRIDGHDRVGRTPLHIAAERGDIKWVQHLLDSGADVNARVRSKESRNSNWGDTPLHAAAREGNVEAARLLISRGADVNAANDRRVTPLHVASHQPQVAEMLLAAGARLDAADCLGRTPLQWAAFDPEDQQARVAALLIKSGAPLDAQDHQGRAAIAYAAAAGNADAALALIKSGADLNLPDRFGATPLHVAAGRANPQMVDLLIRAQAKTDVEDQFGVTPLHDATRMGSAYSVALLLKAGADPRSRDDYGGTPLHLAGRYGRSDIAQMLLQHGADVYAKSDAGMMPIDEAQRAGAPALVQLLRSSAARPTLSAPAGAKMSTSGN